MTAICGPDRFAVSAPAVASQPPPAQLRHWLERKRIDWRREQATCPDAPEPSAIDTRDSWLADHWESYVQPLLQHIPGFFLIRSDSTRLSTPPAIVPYRLLGLKDGRVTESADGVARSAIGAYLHRYYWPYTDPKALGPWLPQLVTTASGFRSAGIGEFGFPEGVHNLETLNDRRTLERLESSMRPSVFRRLNAPLLEPVAPVPPQPVPGEASAAFQSKLKRFDELARIHRRDFERFDRARTQWQRERARAEALIRDPRVDLARQRRYQKLPSVQRIAVLGIPIDNGVLPSNLFLSQIAPFIEPYLAPLRQLEEVFGSAYVTQPVVAWFYFLIGMGLIPNWRHWRMHWGTAVIEDLLPAELDALDVTRQWVERRMVDMIIGAAEDARRTDGNANLVSEEFREAERRLLDGVRSVSLYYLDALTEQRIEQLRFCVEAQGGGRIRLDPTTFINGQPWRLTIDRGSAGPLQVSFPERVAYTDGLDEDARWMLRAIWPQVRSVTALCNQAGVHVRINAANNRWGGQHPPHSSHKQGCDIDWDLGMGGDLVPNLVQLLFRPLPKSDRNLPE